jgi:hypothetical protein
MNKLVVVGVLALSCGVGLVWSSVAVAEGARAADSSDPAQKVGEQKPAKAAKPGKIKLSHEARRVVSCEKVVEDDEAVCKPATREPAKSGAKVKINPLKEDGESATGGEAVSVEIDNQLGEQSRVIEMASGKWELVWQGGTTLRDKFFVDAGDEFDIALQTDIGVCRLKGEQCSLDTEKRQQSIEIPTERGL